MAFSIPLIEEYRPIVANFLDIVTQEEGIGGGVFLMRNIPFDTVEDESGYQELVMIFDHIWSKKDDIKSHLNREGFKD